MIAKLKLPKNVYLEKWLIEFNDKPKTDELFIQKLSLDKITLRMLFTLIDYNRFTKFRFYDCRITKNSLIALNNLLTKNEKGTLSLEISFNSNNLIDSKHYAILVNDKYNTLILRHN